MPATSIKHWRDELDPVHDNPRRGWINREMYPTRKRVVEALGDLSEPELRGLVESFIGSPSRNAANDVIASVTAVDADDDGEVIVPTRGITGHRAEEAFIKYHTEHGLPVPGMLTDRRYDHCGYDFEIVNGAEEFAIEVKGLAGDRGGISLTDREWRVARARNAHYILTAVRNVSVKPEFDFIRNPSSVLTPSLRTYTVVQMDWSVTPSELSLAIGNAHSE